MTRRTPGRVRQLPDTRVARHCDREDDVLAHLIETPHTPLSAPLQAHLGECAGCRDLALVGSALRLDHATALAQVRVPSAGQVWWRAELRARQDAAARATRPITVATGLAAACLLGLLASVAGALAWWVRDWLQDQPLVHALLAPLAGPGTWTAHWSGNATPALAVGALLAVTLLAASAVLAAWREQ